MAAYVLSPERCWTNKQSGRDGQQEASSSDAQQQTPTGPQPTDGVMMRRRISRVFYESHTPGLFTQQGGKKKRIFRSKSYVDVGIFQGSLTKLFHHKSSEILGLCACSTSNLFTPRA